jgi:hypothetical protein
MEQSLNGARIAGGAVIYASHLHRLAAFYRATLGVDECAGDESHAVFESHQFQLVLLRGDAASDPDISLSEHPMERRSAVAIKPVFVVPSIASAREAAARTGGVINADRHEWRFGAYRVCDGLDPEGNVIQLRERIDETASESGGGEAT